MHSGYSNEDMDRLLNAYVLENIKTTTEEYFDGVINGSRFNDITLKSIQSSIDQYRGGRVGLETFASEELTKV